jgi:hypothetical protein
LKHYLSPGAAASSAILRQRPQRARNHLRKRWPTLIHRWRNTLSYFPTAVFRQISPPENRLRSSAFRTGDPSQDAHAFPTDPAPDFSRLDVGVLVQICDASAASHNDDVLLDGDVSAGNEDDARSELPVANGGRLL